MAVKRNLIANYFGLGWSTVMGLAFIPLYIHYLGIEAYGLIGVFAVLQSMLAIVDFGLSPALSREMARHGAGGVATQTIFDLLRSLEMVMLGIALLIGAALSLGSSWVAENLIHTVTVPKDVVTQSVSIMAIVVALRFLESIYRGSLIGLQKQVWFNIANALLATLRHAGVVVVLAYWSPTITAFFLWQGLVSIVSLMTLGIGLYTALPSPQRSPRFSLSALKSIRRFAAGTLVNTLLVVLLTQVDKALLSQMMTIESFGYYTLASTVGSVLYLLAGPIGQAIYPKMVEYVTHQNRDGLESIYHQGAQLVTVIGAPVAMVLCFFSEESIFVWSGNVGLSKSIGPILSILVIGFFLNGLIQIPSILQSAHGWTGLSARTNMVAVLFLVPSVLWIVPQYGSKGAAWIWVALNVGFVAIFVPLMHRKLLPKEKWRWYVSDILVPLLGVILIGLVGKLFHPIASAGRLIWFIYLISIGLMALGAAILLAEKVRGMAMHILRSVIHWRIHLT